MIFYSNTTTARLEAFARARGHNYGIVKSPDNMAGLFFIVSIDAKHLTRWSSLGWTRAEAMDSIERFDALNA